MCCKHGRGKKANSLGKLWVYAGLDPRLSIVNEQRSTFRTSTHLFVKLTNDGICEELHLSSESQYVAKLALIHMLYSCVAYRKYNTVWYLIVFDWKRKVIVCLCWQEATGCKKQWGKRSKKIHPTRTDLVSRIPCSVFS